MLPNRSLSDKFVEHRTRPFSCVRVTPSKLHFIRCIIPVLFDLLARLGANSHYFTKELREVTIASIEVVLHELIFLLTFLE